MTTPELRVLFRAIDTFGEESQVMMAFEEMSELQKEMCKRFRGEKNDDHIAEEIADVEIMLDQLKLMTGTAHKVEWYRDQKLKRLDKRIDEYLEGNVHTERKD